MNGNVEKLNKKLKALRIDVINGMTEKDLSEKHQLSIELVRAYMSRYKNSQNRGQEF